MSATDTPRTNALPAADGSLQAHLKAMDLARQLERENARLRAALADLIDEVTSGNLIFRGYVKLETINAAREAKVQS